MNRQAIRHEGEEAENIFLDLVTGSRKSNNAKKGDALVPLDGNDHYVEIKECQSNTINQVRAIKYIPLIIHAPANKVLPWLVIPPHEIIRLVQNKSRGQHTEIPFECANLSLSTIPPKFRCSDLELDARVKQSISDGLGYFELQELMNNLRENLIILKESTTNKINEIFENK